MIRKDVEAPPGWEDGSPDNRLAVYRRYAEVVRAQLQALQEEDLSRFSELAEDRQRIQDELGQDAPGIPATGKSEAGGQVLVDGARDELEEVMALDRDIQNRLVRMRGKVAAQLRDISSRKDSARAYLTRDSLSEVEGNARLNVRL